MLFLAQQWGGIFIPKKLLIQLGMFAAYLEHETKST